MHEDDIEADAFVRQMVDLANDTRGDRAEMLRLINNAQVAFGVWKDRTQPLGVDLLILKGENLLREMLVSGAKDTSIASIPCVSAEEAYELHEIVGEPIATQ